MKVYVCDRCGAKINPERSRSIITIEIMDQFSRSKSFDLCVSCAYKIKKFMKGEADIKEAEE